MPPRKRQKRSRDNELEPAKTLSRRSSSSGATVTSSSRPFPDSRPTSRAASPPGSETSVSSDDAELLCKPVILTPSMGKAYVDIPLRFYEPIPHHKPSKRTYCTPSMPRPVVEVPTLASLLRARRRLEGRAPPLMPKPSQVEEEPCSVLWLPLPIPKNFNQISAQERISIREFIYRFHRQLFGAPKAWSKKMAADFDNLTENTIPKNMEDKSPNDILFSWVSPRNLAHLLTGLLDALAKATDYPDRDVVMDAAAELRPCKQENLVLTCAAMWTTLAAMDKKLKKWLHLKPPTALPKLVPAIRTRSQVDSIQVSDTAQFVPVVLSLIECVIQQKGKREDEVKGVIEEVKGAINYAPTLRKHTENRLSIASEAARDAHERAAPLSGKGKAKKTLLEKQLDGLTHAKNLIIRTLDCATKPLGTDPAGREYWTLTPGFPEREHAEDLLGLRTTLEVPRTAKEQADYMEKATKSEAERRKMDQWSWLVAVWGSKPGGETGEQRWWGFWKAEDIEQLANWVKFTDVDADSADRAELAAKSRDDLAKNLRDYAKLLKWRANRSEASLPPVSWTASKASVVLSKKGKEKAVESTSFYGPKSQKSERPSKR